MTELYFFVFEDRHANLIIQCIDSTSPNIKKIINLCPAFIDKLYITDKTWLTHVNKSFGNDFNGKYGKNGATIGKIALGECIKYWNELKKQITA